MKIIITRQTFVKGELTEPGTVFESLPDVDVNNLIGAKKAVKYSEEAFEQFKDEYLELVKEMSDKHLANMVKELKIDFDFKTISKEELQKLVADAMRKAEQ